MSRSPGEQSGTSLPPIMSVAPLALVALGFVLGTMVDARCDPPPYLFPAILLLATLVAVALFLAKRAIPLVIPVAVLAVGAATGGLVHHIRRVSPQDTVERFATERGFVVRVRGVVTSLPRLRRSDPGPLSVRAFRAERTTFLVDVETIEVGSGWADIGGRLRVTVREALLDLNEGERVAVFGRLFRLREPGNPGAFDWAAYMRRSGVVATLVTPHRENVRRIDRTATSWWGRLVKHTRHRLRGWLVDDLVTSCDTEAGLLTAMVLGHRSRLDREINDIFIRAGCAHFLAVSGVHIVIVILIAGVGCRWLGVSGRKRLAVLMAVVAMYALIADPRPSIMRSSVIAEIYFLACWIYRETACLNWISATVIILGAIDPGMIFDVGYQLSTAAVIGICFLPAAIQACVRSVRASWASSTKPNDNQAAFARMIAGGRSPFSRMVHSSWRWFCWRLYGALLVSAAAWLATAPIVACYFGRIHPYGVIASLVMFPVLTVLMLAGFAKLVLAMVVPQLMPPLTLFVDSLDSIAVRLADALGSLPYASVPTVAPRWWVLCGYYGALIAIVFYWRRDYDPSHRAPVPVPAPMPVSEPTPIPLPECEAVAERPRRGAWRVPAGTAACAVMLLTVYVWPQRVRDRLTMTVLDVGAGTAIVLELPEGETVLYDAGTLGPINVGRDVVVPFLRQRGIRRIDRVYVSHANLDHYSGLPGVVSEVPCSVVFTNAHFDRDARPGSFVDRWRHLMSAAGCREIPLKGTERNWSYGGATFEWLWPPGGHALEWANNEMSTVLRISYAGRSIMLAGDIEDRAQRALLERGDLHADVLLAPHHGSVRRSSADFFKAVGAATVIRSSGERMAETINGLAKITADAVLWNTADVGAVEVVIDSTGVRAEGFRQP